MDENVVRLVTAPVRGADEDHPSYEGQRLNKQALLEELPALVTEVELLKRDRTNGLSSRMTAAWSSANACSGASSKRSVN